MTEPAQPTRRTSPGRGPKLYRTVLAIAVAAVVAAWLPFSILYINALTQHTVAAAKTGTVLSAGTGAQPPGHSPTPVTTRVS